MFLPDPEINKPQSCSISATMLAKKIIRLMKADQELAEEREKIPDHTGQWKDDDYVGVELEEWNRSAEDLWNYLRNNFERKTVKYPDTGPR